MKQIAHGFLLLVGFGAAFLRWIDLVNFTDVETGFVSVGSVWWRYGALVALLCLALLASFMASRRPKPLEKGGKVAGGFVLVLAVLCAAHNALCAYVALVPGQWGASAVFLQGQLAGADTASLAVACLGLLCAVWLFSIAFALLGGQYCLPAGGVALGIVGNLYFYAVLIVRFAANQSSFYRLDPTISVFTGAAVLWFMAVLLRAMYYPKDAVGRKLYIAGMGCFMLCICFALPQAVYDVMVYHSTFAACSEQLLFAGFGLMGALYAARCLGAEQA